MNEEDIMKSLKDDIVKTNVFLKGIIVGICIAVVAECCKKAFIFSLLG